MPNSNPSSKTPKVSVLMITYNHEKYIEQAVRSVMMQETDFEYELVIGEDYSTDQTRDIVLRLKNEFPDKIQLILQAQNIGMIPNMVAAYNSCRGKYIALCEGDDYWISRHKLQMQIDYMEAHPECRISTHDAQVVNENDEFIRIQTYKNIHNIHEYFATELFIATAVIVFRVPADELPTWFGQFKAAGDWQLHVWLLMQGGEIHHLPGEAMSCRRVHGEGIASFMLYDIPSLSEKERLRRTVARLQQVINDHEVMYQFVPDDIKLYMRARIAANYATLARLCYDYDRDLFWKAYEQLRRLAPRGRYIPSSPVHLSLMSRLLGYPRAEWLARTYRKLIPVSLRKQLYQHIYCA